MFKLTSLLFFLVSVSPGALLGQCPSINGRPPADPATPVTGIVETEAGDPIEGAVVEYEESINVQGERPNQGLRPMATTDTVGVFTFPFGSCSGIISVRAENLTRGVSTWPSRKAGEQIRITLFAPASFRGSFEAVPDKEDIHIRWSIYNTVNGLHGSRVQIDDNGEFLISNLFPGELKLSISSRGGLFRPVRYENIMITAGQNQTMAFPAITLPPPFTVEKLEQLSAQMSDYIKNDWRQEDEASRKKQMMAFLDELDLLTYGRGMTPSRLSRFFQKTLFGDWTVQELEREISNGLGMIDGLHLISNLYMEKFSSLSPLSEERHLVNFLDEENYKNCYPRFNSCTRKERRDIFSRLKRQSSHRTTAKDFNGGISTRYELYFQSLPFGSGTYACCMCRGC